MVLKLWYLSKISVEFVKARITGLHPKSYWFIKSRWGPRTCIFNSFLGDADRAGRGPHFGNHWQAPAEALQLSAHVPSKSGPACFSSLFLYRLPVILTLIHEDLVLSSPPHSGHLSDTGRWFIRHMGNVRLMFLNQWLVPDHPSILSSHMNR